MKSGQGFVVVSRHRPMVVVECQTCGAVIVTKDTQESCTLECIGKGADRRHVFEVENEETRLEAPAR